MAVLEPTLDWAAAEKARLRNIARANLLSSGRAVTLQMLAHGRNRQLAATRKWVSRHSEQRHLATVEHDGRIYVPTFQLTDAFDLNANAAEVVGRLVEAGMDGWSAWDWVATPNGWLDGTAPQDLIDTDPGAVRRAIDGLLQE